MPSRAPSELSSWQDVHGEDAGGSSEDLTDMDDTSCVSLAPRRGQRACAVHLPPLSSLSLAQAGRRASGAAPAEPPASAVMLRDGLSDEAGQPGASASVHPVLRMRRNASASQLAGAQAEGGHAADAASGVGLAAAAADCLPGAGAGGQRSLCELNADTDVLWTFLAGMLLYITSM
jgi:hypothetical protein